MVAARLRRFRFLRTTASAVAFASLLYCAFILPIAANAGTLNGFAKNGTSGKPAAGVEIILIQLQGGMQPVANTKTDAQGQFTFDNPGIGTAPMLVRAVYNGINFHEPVPPDKTTSKWMCSSRPRILRPSHYLACGDFPAERRDLDCR